MKMNLAVTSSLFLLACGSSTTPPAEAPAAEGAQHGGEHGAGHEPSGAGAAGKCHQIATTCHEQAGFSELAKECHNLGHVGDSAKCEARHDGCVAECQKAAKTGPHALPAGGEGHKPGPH